MLMHLYIFGKEIKLNAIGDKLKSADRKLIAALPEGHPERIQLEELKKETITTERDNGETQDTSITIDAEEVNDAKTQLLRKYQEKYRTVFEDNDLMILKNEL